MKAVVGAELLFFFGRCAPQTMKAVVGPVFFTVKAVQAVLNCYFFWANSEGSIGPELVFFS